MFNEQLDGQLRLPAVDPLEGKEFLVCKRDGRVIPFDETRIFLAIESAFKAEAGLDRDAQVAEELKHKIRSLTDAVTGLCLGRALRGEALSIELIQDAVETHLMAGGHHTVAKSYIVYREERRKARALRGDRTVNGELQAQLFVTNVSGDREPLLPQKIRQRVQSACRGLEGRCNSEEILDETLRNLYDGVHTVEITKAMVMAAKARIEIDPSYSYVAARLLLRQIYMEVIPDGGSSDDVLASLRNGFRAYLEKGVKVNRLSADLLGYDINRMAAALQFERDDQFSYMGLQTIYDRYLIHHEDRRIEAPQYFWMRVSMK